MERLKLFLILLLWLKIIHACEEPCLYYSIGNTINSINLSAGKTASSVVVQDIGRVFTIAVDVEDNYIYWSDFGGGTIKRMDLQTNIKENVTKGVGRVEGIAIDWISKDIFWTDTTNNRIEMAKVDGSDRKILFDRDIDEPRGIAVDSINGYIFWTDWGSSPKIERATLDGKERVTIVETSSSFPLQWVNGVIVDYADSKSAIYWVDTSLGTGVVGRADLDGRNRKLSKEITNSLPVAIALHNGTVYLSDNRAKKIRLVDKTNLEYLGNLDLSFPEIHGITVLDGSRQPLIDLVAVSITLEMKMEEWEEDKFKQAVVKGIKDYCYEDTCSYKSRNTSIAKQLCSIFPNDSNTSSAQIRVLKQPGESSVLNHTEVVFSLILRTQSNSSRMVIKNSNLDYIVQKSVYYISKHLGGYKVIYVNCNPPSFEKFCNYTELPKDINGEEVAKGVSSKKGTIDSITAGTVTSGIVIVIIIACVFIWCKRRSNGANVGDEQAQEMDNVEYGDREPGQELHFSQDVDVNSDSNVQDQSDSRNNRIHGKYFSKDDQNTGNTTGPDETDLPHYPARGPTHNTGRPVQDGLPSTSTSETGSEDDMPQNGSNSSFSKSEPDECNIVEDETPGIEADKKINKESNGMNQTDNAAAELKNANDNDSNRDQAKVTVNRRSFKVADIPYPVWSKICLKLNKKDNLSFRDYRSLGEKMGFDKDIIKNLKQTENPTDRLLEQWSFGPEATVERLIKILREDDVARYDVATILEEWLEKQISNK
ncbi:uncharacterized protein [Pocillopora verrucosa]|uniref:uncharacterized protein n=1 Tax=Pocillopora verrucosa TaxID=203993 RepID=UPI0033422D41